MITPINFAGLKGVKIEGKPIIDKMLKGGKTQKAYSYACNEIDRLSGSRDVYMHIDVENPEKTNIASLRVVGKKGQVLAETYSPTSPLEATAIQREFETLVARYAASIAGRSY